MRTTLMQLLILLSSTASALLLGPAAFSPSRVGASTHAALAPRLHTQRARTARCAYDPTPKKVKSKTPKEKVKAPTSTAEQLQLTPERVFFEGPPSITETFIPGLSLFTVIGAIPFAASLARQAWTRYKITNKRLEVTSGFQGKDVVQVTWKEVTDAKWLRRFGGTCGDLVLTLRDGAKLEMRSLPEFDRNLNFIMEQLPPGFKDDCGYPDKPAREFLEKVASGAEPPVEFPAAEDASA
mmetsp:Transcript_39961/g.87692  ORF Transcript_39961/g.87692 Transcript_39961/m.87692 type:complete len:239 (+) Transcript_39961:56-772(+)